MNEALFHRIIKSLMLKKTSKTINVTLPGPSLNPKHQHLHVLLDPFTEIKFIQLYQIFTLWLSRKTVRIFYFLIIVCMLYSQNSSNPTSVICAMYFLEDTMVAFSGHVSLKSSQDSWDNSSFIPFHNFHHPLGSQYALCLTEADARHNYAK